jgi:hypothetical protein
LALRAEEGRGKTAKSLGELSSELSRGFPNGATLPSKTRKLLAEHIGQEGATGGTETSKYPEERRLFP